MPEIDGIEKFINQFFFSKVKRQLCHPMFQETFNLKARWFATLK